MKFNPKIKKLGKGLFISRDYNLNPKFFFPVFLFVPNKDDHFHISLTKRNAIALRDWLTKYINDRG